MVSLPLEISNKSGLITAEAFYGLNVSGSPTTA